MNQLTKKFILLSLCLLTYKAQAAEGDRILTGHRLRTLKALNYIGSSFTNPPQQRYIDHLYSDIKKHYPALKLTRTNSVTELRRCLDIGTSVIEGWQYKLSEEQVRVLSGWKGSSQESSSSQLAAIIRRSSSPVWRWSDLNTPGTRYVGFALGLGASCLAIYTAYKAYCTSDCKFPQWLERQHRKNH